jgi:demethylmenaquinone methyltransferase/2-methoxy-6-polyprenyl-1,4-benzoquinol methylase
MTIEQYYRERAPEYDEFYRVPRRQGELGELKNWLIERARGRKILEIAAGTGYWTQVAASVAKAITATDYNSETLAIAADRGLGPHVKLIRADAYMLPDFAESFDAGMAMLWWSHVDKQRYTEFLWKFTAHLEPGALLLMMDQVYLEPFSTPSSRRDGWGNQYAVRKLANGSTYEIIKNYPSDEELRETFARSCEDICIMRTHEFWTLSARVRV